MSQDQRQTVIIATLFGVLFLATVDNQLLIPLLPTLGREFGVSVQNLGWLLSSYALVAALSSLFLGPLSDRFGRVIFLRLGLVFFFVIGRSSGPERSPVRLLEQARFGGCEGQSGGMRCKER